MNHFGIYKASSFVPRVKIGDVESNSREIIKAVKDSGEKDVDCLVFPELSVTGYTCADLFQQALLMEKAEEAVREIAAVTADLDILIAVGAPVMAFGKRYNCAVMICRGQIAGIVPKSYLPNYGEFYEKRWFVSGKDVKNSTVMYAGKETPFGTDLIFIHKGAKIGVEICEDLWVPQPPSGGLAMAGADIILNLSASNETIGKHDYLIGLISQQSARCRCAYVYSSAGWGESSTDLVFSGKAIIAVNGNVAGGENRFLTHSFSETAEIDIQKLRLDRARFSTFNEEAGDAAAYRMIATMQEPAKTTNPEIGEDCEIDPMPFVPNDKDRLSERCEEISNIQAYGLMRRLDAIGCKKVVVGISGGLDSTLALLVAVRAFDRLGLSRSGIIAVTMPGFATSTRTHNNAILLMEKLGVTIREINIGKAVGQHFEDIGQDPQKYDATYENSQARERTQILMDLANMENGIVIGTGDMSELALGWCTYNGDQMSMYGVNVSVPKTLVKHLVNWYSTQTDPDTSAVLKDIIDTPISPELVPSATDDIAQKTEDLVGPYELHDFYLYHFLRNSFTPEKIYRMAVTAFKGRYDSAIILKWLKVFLKRFFSQQFKRSCMPDGPKVGSVSLSPRGDWRMPSDASVALWLEQLDKTVSEK